MLNENAELKVLCSWMQSVPTLIYLKLKIAPSAENDIALRRTIFESKVIAPVRFCNMINVLSLRSYALEQTRTYCECSQDKVESIRYRIYKYISTREATVVYLA